MVVAVVGKKTPPFINLTPELIGNETIQIQTDNEMTVRFTPRHRQIG
jgi:hypothetical protein